MAREMGGTPTTRGGEGHVQLIVHVENKYIGFKLAETDKGWNIHTINEVQFGGCCHKKFILRAVTSK